MNASKLKKGLIRMAVFILLCFTAPVVVYQAFKNQEHPLFWPALIVGFLLISLAVIYGFWGIKTLSKALLGEKKSSSI